MKTVAIKYPRLTHLSSVFCCLLSVALFSSQTIFGAIAKVQLVSPSNGSTDVSPCVTLTWDAASGATGYYYEVLSNSQVVFSGGSGGTTNVSLTLSDGTTYQWQVQGRTSQNTGPFSDTWSFTTKPPIPTPTLVAPPNGGQNDSLNVTLVWDSVGSLATEYNFQVNNSDGSIATNNTVSAEITNVTVTLAEGTYTWMVQGATSCRNGAWSAVSSFTIPPIPVPVQDSPANGATGVGLQPTLQWEAAAGATGYDYELYSGDGASLIESNATTSLSAQINTILAQNTVYSWQVRGHTTARDGAWSPLASFTTVPPLTAPVLLTPTNNATGTGLNVALNWQTVSGATGYNYEVLQDGAILQSNNGSPPQSIVLEADGVYQWQVQAETSLRTGPWSAPFTFATQPPIPTPTLVAPPNGGDNYSLNVMLEWDSVGALATHYAYEVFNSDGSIAASNTVTGENTNVTIRLAQGDYTWTVQGFTSERQGAWAAPFSFTIPPIPTPVLVSPPNGAVTNSTNITLVWDSVGPGATHYAYEVYNQDGSIAASNTVTGENTNVTVSLTQGSYTWTVQGFTSARQGVPSAPFSFDATYIPAPNLLTPTNGSMGTGLNVTLNWQSVGGAIGYNYEILQNGGIVQSNSGLPPQSINLQADGIYQWQVQAVTAKGPGLWSAPFTFDTVVPGLPQIYLQPVGQILQAGYPSSVTFSVLAFGASSLTYQWFDGTTNLTDNADISGSTSSTLTLTNLQPEDAGDYYVSVQNTNGEAISDTASLIFQPQLSLGVESLWQFYFPPGTPPETVAYLQVTILPSVATNYGAGWLLEDVDASYQGSNPSWTAKILGNESNVVKFSTIQGWYAPTNNSVELTPGGFTNVSAYYTPAPLMTVSPQTNLIASGYAGGPIFMSNLTYTIANVGITNLQWWAAETPSWLSLTATSGILGAGQSTNVTLLVNTNIYSLSTGVYAGVVQILNSNNSLGNMTNTISLNLGTHPDVVLDDFSAAGNGGAQITLQGLQGSVYQILSSSNLLTPLSNWIPVLTITNVTGSNTFALPLPTSPQQFYRAKEL